MLAQLTSRVALEKDPGSAVKYSSYEATDRARAIQERSFLLLAGWLSPIPSLLLYAVYRVLASPCSYSIIVIIGLPMDVPISMCLAPRLRIPHYPL